MRCLIIMCLTLSCIGCSAEPATLWDKSADKPEVAVDGRDQYELALAVVGARAVDPEEDPAALSRVVSAWQGRRYRWEVRWVAPLCSSPDACVVAPFDHNRFEQPVVQGWLPGLTLQPEQHAQIATMCDGLQGCVLTFEAELGSLVLSHELPTSVHFDDVEVIGARAMRGDESWVRRRRS